MIRDVDLIEYLPQFMRNYDEIVAALEAENPEFKALWEETNKVLYNRFITTADEYGISRFEKMLGIMPNNDDTLEFRKAVVKSTWCSQIPYTENGLKDKLKILCGNSENFIYEYDNNLYLLKIKLALSKKSVIDEVLNILNKMVPHNIRIKVELLYNTHEILSAYKHIDLKNYTYGQLRDEVL